MKEKKEERSLPELILPEDYQKGRREDGKKNVSAAIRVIFDNPDDCLFIIGKCFLRFSILPNHGKLIHFPGISVFVIVTQADFWSFRKGPRKQFNALNPWLWMSFPEIGLGFEPN